MTTPTWHTLLTSGIPTWYALLTAVIGIVLGYIARYVWANMKETTASLNAKNMLEHARRDAEAILKDGKIQAKEQALSAREAIEEESKEYRKDLFALEERLGQREDALARKVAALDRKEQVFEARHDDLERQKAILVEKETTLNQLTQERHNMLQHVASMSREEAKSSLMKDLQDELQSETAALIRRTHEDAKESAEREARKVITTAIQRYAADQTNQITSCSVHLPSEEMKGRIIGKDGRNIRSLEATTGVNILIDETPEVVVISGFDPLRREIARITLESLIADGRIHPTRIEEVAEQTAADLEETVRTAGEEAMYELGLPGVAPQVLRTLGKLKFRHSYGQNVLAHSIEMGHIMGMMAAELQLDQAVARRIGLLHDIGKAMDHTTEGGHAIAGADLLRKNNESPVVVNAVAAHHNEVPGESMYAALTKAADTITASRPGARSETTEIYLKRLKKLERIASQFEGVDKTYAIQAGREIRVVVEPNKVDDNEAMQMARDISKQIEAELEYPGQIKVTVVRETRCIEYAR